MLTSISQNAHPVFVQSSSNVFYMFLITFCLPEFLTNKCWGKQNPPIVDVGCFSGSWVPEIPICSSELPVSEWLPPYYLWTCMYSPVGTWKFCFVIHCHYNQEMSCSCSIWDTCTSMWRCKIIKPKYFYNDRVNNHHIRYFLEGNFYCGRAHPLFDHSIKPFDLRNMFLLWWCTLVDS